MENEREVNLDKTELVSVKFRKMSGIEKKIRRWWMQRQLWNAYEKAATLLWDRYQNALIQEDEITSNALFQQTLHFRLLYEKERDMINAVFKTEPEIEEWKKENS